MRRITVVLGLAVLMAATVVLTAGAAVAQASFTAPQSFRTGDTAEAVVSADFNGDSKADLAVANNGSNSDLLTDNVSVLLGNGDGTYGTAQNFSVGDAPLHLTSADFNGDTKADLAVVNIRSDNVSILLGNGDGTFGAAQNFGGVDGPFSVSSADFNGDSKADLAVAYNGAFTIPGGVSVRLGNGDGTFGAAQNFVAGLHPTSVSSADFNGDSKVDLATANAGSDNVSVLLGKGDGTFAAAQNFAAADSPWFVTSTDFNDDSKVDLATANAPSIMGDGGLGNVSVLLGNGDGTFGTAQNFGAGDTPVYLASADFDSDSKVDLAVANNSSDNVSVLSGNGDGIFQTAQNFAAGSSPSSLVGGMFNNDSEADLAVTNEILSGTVSIMLNNTDTTAPTTKAPTHTFTTLSTLGTSTVPVKLTWSATDNTGGSGIASYHLQQSVNGGPYTNIALPSATATTISPSLAPGPNTYRYRVTATDNASNVSAWVAGPSFKVSTYQESSSAIVDTGSWTTSALSGAYGGSVQSASALGKNATFTVPSGTKNVEWISYRGPNRGKAQVWLDGVQQDANPTLTGIQPFDLYSSTAQARKVVFSKAVSSTTSHKLEVRVLGQKNGSSTSTRVDIDAFVRTS
jgi:FG-GAP-like repeat/FG-GAP repeat